MGLVGSNPTPGAYGRTHVPFLGDYLRWASRRYKASTVEGDVRVFKALMRRLGKRFDELPDSWELVLADLQGRGDISNERKYVILTSYRRLLVYAGVKPPPAVEEYYRTLERLRESKLCRIPSEKVARAVIAAMRGRGRALLLLCLETGLRLGEALSLRWEQVDIQGRRIIMELSSKRSEGSYIPLSDKALEVLQELPRLSPYVFTTPDKQGSFKRNLWRSLGRARRRMRPLLGDEVELVNPKNLRHLFGTRLFMATRDIVYVQRLLRHRSILTTQRYIHRVLQLPGQERYDVRVVRLGDPQAREYIKTLLEEGFAVALQTSKLVYLRRLKT